MSGYKPRRPAPPPPNMPGSDTLKQYFDRVDSNKSGTITPKELQAALVNGNNTEFNMVTINLMISMIRLKILMMNPMFLQTCSTMTRLERFVSKNLDFCGAMWWTGRTASNHSTGTSQEASTRLSWRRPSPPSDTPSALPCTPSSSGSLTERRHRQSDLMTSYSAALFFMA